MGVVIPSEIRFDEAGLIPAIIQDEESGQVLMLAYMNRESLARTLETGETWFYSRSRRELWHKGATSGNYQYVVAASYDCDADALLFKVHQAGVACHTGKFSCFHNNLPVKINTVKKQKFVSDNEMSGKIDLGKVIAQVFQVIRERKTTRPEGSYTGYLFNSGQDKILKKIGEEAAEAVIASKNDNKEEILYELADLYYHTLVLLALHNLSPEDLALELSSRLPSSS